MDQRRLTFRGSTVVVVIGALGWLISGALVFGVAFLLGVLGLAVGFVVWGAPGDMDPQAPGTLRAGDRPRQTVPRSSKTMAGPY
jgi:hypothetical protein